MVVYVRNRSSKTWHWCRNCTDYPLIIDESSFVRPDSNLCTECSEIEIMGI